MSVKAQALVWDLECPKKYGELMFKPSHKYVLIAYADHADHNGMNMWPAIPTISRKTGLDERSVQRLVHDLEKMGLLVRYGQGPKGTIKFCLPYNDGGDKLSPVTKYQGDKNEDSLGDIPSGDIPSGDKLTPELKEPEPLSINLNINESRIESVWQSFLEGLSRDMPRSAFETWVNDTKVVRFDGNTLVIGARNEYARDWLENRIKSTTERALVGILAQEVRVEFVVAEGAQA